MVITRFCRDMGYVAFTRFCCKSGFVANTRFFGFVLSRLLLRHKGFYSDFVQISAQKIGGWDLWAKGLFRAATLQSGTTLLFYEKLVQKTIDKDGLRMLEKLGCAEAKNIRECLLLLDAEAFVDPNLGALVWPVQVPQSPTRTSRDVETHCSVLQNIPSDYLSELGNHLLEFGELRELCSVRCHAFLWIQSLLLHSSEWN